MEIAELWHVICRATRTLSYRWRFVYQTRERQEKPASPLNAVADDLEDTAVEATLQRLNPGPR